MLPLMVSLNYEIDLTAIMTSPTIWLIGGLIITLLILWSDRALWGSLKPIPVWLSYQWFAFRANHKLHIRGVLGLSIVVVYGGSGALILMLALSYLRVWMANPFSMPLLLSAIVILLIASIPGLIGAPMLIFIKRYPPQTWMSSRIARLSHPF